MSHRIHTNVSSSPLLETLRSNLSDAKQIRINASEEIYQHLVEGIKDYTSQGFTSYRNGFKQNDRINLEIAIQRLRDDGLRVTCRGAYNSSGEYTYTVTIRV